MLRSRRRKLVLFALIMVLVVAGYGWKRYEQHRHIVVRSWIMIGTLGPITREQAIYDLDTGGDPLVLADKAEQGGVTLLGPSDRQREARVFVRNIAKTKSLTFTER